MDEHPYSINDFEIMPDLAKYEFSINSNDTIDIKKQPLIMNESTNNLSTLIVMIQKELPEQTFLKFFTILFF